jgi:hypothetical protein
MENNERNRIKAELLSQFGYDADLFSIVLAAIIEKRFEAMNQKIDSSIEATNEFRDKIKEQVKPLQITNDSQAFFIYWYPATVFLIVSVLALFGMYRYYEFGKKQDFLKYSDKIELLLEQAQIQEDSDGNEFIILKPAISIQNCKIGRHYHYNQDMKSITVPISKADKTGFSLFSNPLYYFKPN